MGCCQTTDNMQLLQGTDKNGVSIIEIQCSRDYQNNVIDLSDKKPKEDYKEATSRKEMSYIVDHEVFHQVSTNKESEKIQIQFEEVKEPVKPIEGKDNMSKQKSEDNKAVRDNEQATNQQAVVEGQSQDHNKHVPHIKQEWKTNKNMFVKMNSGKNVNDHYDIHEMIGQGGFGKVYKVVHRITKMVRAMKMISKDKLKKEDEDKLLIETSIMIQLDHGNIVKLFEIFKDDQNYYLISEYCDGGELFEKIRHVNQLSEKIIASYMKEILSAISYCHKHGIVHRDLKPENILFDTKKPNATLKIIDFGASAKLQNAEEKLTKRIGTPFYVAPEVLQSTYNEKCDIWSIGVILYIMLCGYPPFFGVNELDILQKVKKGQYSFDTNDWGKVSIQAKDLIRRMLFLDPAQRITAIDAFNHPWIQNNNTKGQLQNQVLSKLSDFQVKNKLKMAILEFISVQVMTSQEKKDLMKEFQDLDKNGDGMVSKNELYQAYKKLLKDKIKAQKVVDDIFNDIDTNGSGKVDFSEFVAAAINREQKLSKQKIEQSFKLFDLDGNGFITREEIQEIFGGNELDEAMWNEILRECDKNNDGMISQHEFIDLLALKIQLQK